MSPIFSSTPSLVVVAGEKENSSNQNQQTDASPPINSLFKNIFKSFSPLKAGFGTFAPFNNYKSNSNEAVKKDSTKRQTWEISSTKIDDPELRNLIRFGRRLAKKSNFFRKTAQIIRKKAENAQIALNQPPIDTFLLPCLGLAQAKVHHSLRGEGSQSRSLEGVLVAKKHALSHRFQTAKIEYPIHSKKGQKQFAFSGDSITFEFFNTLAPLLPGSYFANIDVFLCGINSKERNLHFWEHIFTFISAVNQKKRQNRVQEIWLPRLADCCDELLIVVEGRVEGEEFFNGGIKMLGKRKSMPASKQQRKWSPMKKNNGNGMMKEGGKKRERDEGKEGRELVKGGGKLTAKRRRTVDSGMLPEIEIIEVKKGAEKRGRNANCGGGGINQSSIFEEKLVRKLPIINKQPLMVFRGLKSVGKWKGEIVDGKGAEAAAHFQPFYTHNGIILNLYGLDEPKLVEAAIDPDYAFIEALNQRTKNGARGTCHMLQMEVSNEHGFGVGNLEGILPKSKHIRKKIAIPKAVGGQECCQQEICYNFVKSSKSSPNSSSSEAKTTKLNALKALPMAKQPLLCLICANIQFRHIWELSIHFIAVHPFLQFDILTPDSPNANKICINVLEVNTGNGRICKKNFLLNRSATNQLRKKLLYGNSEKEKATENSDEQPVNRQQGNINNGTGKLFKGVLPFNKPIYTPLDSTPFPNLFGVDCDRGWIRDSYDQRLSQFTDVAAKEKAFFALWNSFIGQRADRVLAVQQLPKMLIAFVDKYGEELSRSGLLSNFLHHCALLKTFGYIDGSEMTAALMHAEAQTAKWRK